MLYLASSDQIFVITSEGISDSLITIAGLNAGWLIFCQTFK